jgi:hypothetical protein
VQPGEIVLIDDKITRFDHNKPKRRCCVYKVQGPPDSGIWVVPRSTKGKAGTFVPKGVLPILNEDGRFMYIPRFVSEADLEGVSGHGVLPDPYKQTVLDNVNPATMEIDW